MAVLTMSILTNVVSHHEMLNQMALFAGVQGWTVQDNLQNVQWQSGGFIAGSESFVRLNSSGNGSQTLHYRFRGEASGATADHEYIQMGAFKAGATDIDTASATHPVQRANPGGVSNWNQERFHSANPNGIPKVWLFGSDRFICMVYQLDPTYVQCLAFGSLDLYDAAEDEGNYAGQINTTSASTAHWFNKNNILPFDFTGDDTLYDGDNKPANEIKSNCRFIASNNTPVDDGVSYSHLVVPNGYSSVRPPIQPAIIVQHDSDGIWRGLGKLPIYRVDHTNLAIGEVLDFGSEKYVCFPNGRLNERVKGLAVRIA